MQLECPHCNRLLEFAAERPAFCGFCGKPLVGSSVHEAATVAYASRDTASEPAAAASAQTSSQPPAAFGEYRLMRELGRGGMGVVYEAEQVATGRRVALKLLASSLPRTQETTERFLREGRLAAALSHPRSTFVYGAGEHAGQPYIAMELMPGRTLKDVIETEGPLPVHRAVDYMLDVIDGLEAAHHAGVIHRDVKPSNCFLDGDGHVKVGDFGLSKSLVSDATLTRTGSFMGTPAFAAPEQVRGEKVDGRTDVYSVGATLFYLISRRGPFAGDPAAVIAQIASDAAPPLRSVAPAVPADLDAVVARTLEKDPERRYANLAQLRQALLPFATGGTSIADVGRRLGAYMIDWLSVSMVNGVMGGMVGGLFGVRSGSGAMTPEEAGQWMVVMQWSAQVVGLVLMVGYFTIAEGVWGRGVGKLLMGLRVVRTQGEPVGLARAFLRALFLPGGLGLQMAILFALMSGRQPGVMDVRYMLLQSVVPDLVILGCLVTMRARNGYRGLHELVSGTRVIRLRTADAARLREIPVVAPVAIEGGGAFGPFRAIASIGRSGQTAVQLARDDVLHRPVWIYLAERGAAPLAGERIGLSRPTRPRWLQGGETSEFRWDAFEAVVGTSLPDAARASGQVDWDRGRSLLLDLAEELAAAVGDGTLPSSLSLDQVWVDRSGRVKLLDAPILPLAGEPATVTDEAASASPPIERALELLRAAVAVCTRGQLLPGHAQEFVAELERRPAEPETLTWAIGRLSELAQHVAVLRWDHRLGIMGVTAGTEYTFYWLCGLLTAILLWSVEDLRVELRLGPTLALDFLVPAAIAFWLRGGFGFWLMGIELRRPDGRSATRLRCAVRSAVAWFPLVMSNATLPVLMRMGSTAMVIEPGESPPIELMLASLGGCFGGCAVLFAFAAAIYAVARPQRGIQDLLVGTCLAPR